MHHRLLKLYSLAPAGGFVWNGGRAGTACRLEECSISGLAMAFAGKVWRLLVGIKDALALLFLLLFFAALFAVLSMRPSPASIRQGALLLDLDGSVVEEAAEIQPLQILLSGTLPTREFAARDLIRAIDAAAKDDRVKALALDMTTFLGGGQVHLQEIGAAMDRFRAAKKPILTYAVAYTDDSLLLASHATEVWVDPLGGAAIAGPGGTRMYYAGLIDKLKINAHVFRVGTYKSAVEPYLRDGMSPEARENYEAVYGALWAEWKAAVKQARPTADIDLATQRIPEWLDASGGNLAEAALKAGLADRAGTRVEWGQRLAQIAGPDRWSKRPGAFAATDYDDWLGSLQVPRAGAPIGVITIAGEITDGDAGPGSAGAERIVDLLDAGLDDGYKALVVRVNSPGGTVTGSEAIRRAILRYKARNIPVAISMGNVAASGGYWVSTSGDRIFAEPETITGSIGIFATLPTFENTLAQIGVQADGVRTTPLSGQPDVIGGLTPEMEAVLQATVESGYRTFLSLVAKSRGITPQRADELGQGRVWDGGTARQLGLVDEFGDLDAALQWAARQARLKDGDWHAVYLADAPNPYAALLTSMLGTDSRQEENADVFALFTRREALLAARALTEAEELLSARGVQARCIACPAPVPTLAPAPGAGEGVLTGLLRKFLLG
ncbi:signal peptide peptidase SppA [Altererythrobacter sp. B11]|uniref:signal peptide peptidase SppA n=1 Tax=Altererythrobacter sp. B11 TaxID=2060312 RepID=UPI000DC6FAD5|nr:signal peptide peptidase SppA [Altererythrobacter sp. B11]BBC74243.1 signal peptide peptidase SppA [Altererythrobacter sp. B11]